MAKRFEEHQIKALRSAFEASDRLTKSRKNELAEATGLDVEQVSSWFSRERAGKKARESVFLLEFDYLRLQEALRLSLERENVLQLEIEECKKKAVEIEAENQRLRESCKRAVEFDEV
ncbi:homeobox-leucine zipper protein HAT5-like [Salvia miltiorrhiza]|uniref:homeobox-leucine zipper protein HAT5-like n=1 Tax=Salvia miltiorrhiza TaxID=226208 RepID=UPI0025AD4CAF|nr:homeobox-leucine zipper protein HAT5-like [Salvia miltiorrhiza]